MITYLAQDRHSSYGRDSLTMLRRSVTLLFEHYNRKAKDDMLFFHTGLNASVQASVLELCRESRARFLLLASHHFRTPPGTPPASKWKQTTQYSAGYRHMIRFYTLGIWEVVRDEGYEYVMRMDEDSLLWSPIGYNLFQFVASRNIEYAYRLTAWEHGFHGFSGDYFFRFPRMLAAKGILPESSGWLLDSCVPGRRNIGNFTFKNCGEPWGVYNNFFISKVSFWFRPDVRRFLVAINESNLVYTLRFNDILWHSTAIKVFMRSDRVFLFQDWAYEHITFRDVVHGGLRTRKWTGQCAQVGALALGSEGTKHEPARKRAREVLKAEACMIAQSVTKIAITRRRVVRCVIAQPQNRSALDVIAFGAASISTEQPVCDREPRPYYCNREDINSSTSPAKRVVKHKLSVCAETQMCRPGGCPTVLKV